MAKFIVKSNIDHNGVRYVPGEVIELTLAQALAMPWAVQSLIVRAAPAKPKESEEQ
jgi:hypothetical protein